MFKSIKVRASQGTQYIPDPRRANPAACAACRSSREAV
jgi:hypothetical protein